MAKTPNKRYDDDKEMRFILTFFLFYPKLQAVLLYRPFALPSALLLLPCLSAFGQSDVSQKSGGALNPQLYSRAGRPSVHPPSFFLS